MSNWLKEIYAASDVFLMPSRFANRVAFAEMMAMRYGTLAGGKVADF